MTARELSRNCNKNVNIMWVRHGMCNEEVNPSLILDKYGDDELSKFWESNIYAIFPSLDKTSDIVVSVYY